MKIKLPPLITSLLLTCVLAGPTRLHAADAIPCQLGPVGGTFLAVPGPGQLRVLTVAPGGPGAAAGLQPGDIIYAAFGENFSPFPESDFHRDGWKGCVQDFGEAIERAESGNVPLPLKIVRPGVGGFSLSVNLPAAGAFGGSYPLGSPKFDAMYEYAVARIFDKVMASGDDFASADNYNDGWFGLCLLSHADWNSVAGPRPYRNSINRIRDWAVTRLQAAILEPLEEQQPEYVDGGLENWHLAMDGIFLAQYRLKSGDSSVDATIQRAAELLANRIQYWPGSGDGSIGRSGHGGVEGDYKEGGINIISVQLQLAMAMLKAAGANLSVPSGTAAGPTPQSFTLEERAQLGLDWLKQCTQVTPGVDLGNVGYQGIQEDFGFDSSGRTAATVTAYHLWNRPLSVDDSEKLALMRDYLAREWQKFQNSHVVTICGANFYQMALPLLPDRDQRFIMENIRFSFNLQRTSDSTLAYFPGRMDFDSDLALGGENVALINVAMARVIAGGTLPSFPLTNTTRLNARMKTPWVSWPTRAAHAGRIKGSAPAVLDVEITDHLGAPVTSGISAAWSKVSGPGDVDFGNAAALSTSVTFSTDGVYRIQLVADNGSYTLTEPYDFTVELNPITPPAPAAPQITAGPPELVRALGDTATMTLTATGDGPLVYRWRRNGISYWPASGSPDLVLENLGGFLAGAYDCEVTGPGGVVTSGTGFLSITDAGVMTAGGLWRDKFTGSTDLAAVKSLARFPYFPQSGKALTMADAPFTAGDSGGYFATRWAGWLHVESTGDYRLLATTGGEGGVIEVSLSTDQHPENATVRVTASAGDAGYRVWSTAPASDYVQLVAGQRYFIQVLTATYAEGPGEAIALQKLGDPLPEDGSSGIPGAQLEYLTGGVYLDQLPPPYQLWQSYNFSPGEILDPALGGGQGDIDKDGNRNLLEYATGTPARSSNASPLFISSGALLTVRYTRNVNALDSNLSLEEAVSPAGGWTPVTLTPTIISTVNGIQTLEVTIPGAGANRKFVRLRATP